MHTSTLSPSDRAAFAVSSRLLACLVTESLLTAVFVPNVSTNAVGACLILSKHANIPLKTPYRPADIFVIVSLRTPPVFKPGSSLNEVGLVDPLDMLPCIYQVCDDPGPLQPDSSFGTCDGFTANTTFSLSLDPLGLWKKLCAELHIRPEREADLAQELRSSFLWQKHAYDGLMTRPTLASTSLEWEHALLEGHPTHPMHRARCTVAPMDPLSPAEYDFYNPHVRLVSLPRTSLTIQGDFESLLSPLCTAAERSAGTPVVVPAGHILFPVHELQIPNIVAKFPDAIVLPEKFSVLAPAQASLRTVTLPCSPSLTLKLALGIKVSSALRTISHFTAYAGPRFSKYVLPHLALDRGVLVIENEVASAIYRHPDPSVAQHCTAIMREVYDGEARDETVVLAAALTEIADGDTPLVVAALNLDTVDKKFAFLDRYVNLLFDAFIPPLLINGVAFEAHGQNTLVRFDKRTGALKGFVFRDFGGFRIHAPTLFESTGINLKHTLTLPGHCIVAPDLHAVHQRLYHTLINSHLHRLIRVLGFHHDGRGWALARRVLTARVPIGCSLWEAWLNPQQCKMVVGKCLLRMKLEGVYREAIYEPLPNLILYEPLEEQN